MDSRPNCQSSASDISYLGGMATPRKQTRKTPVKSRRTAGAKIKFHEMIQFMELFNTMLQSEVVDENRTMPGSEPVYKSVYDEHEKLIIKSKLFYILNLLPGQ